MSQDSAALSLLSLSIAASNAQPIPLNEQSSKHPGALSHHRRLSSTGRRRRLSDARDAASRPLSVGSPGLSMAALTLSTEACSKEHTPHWRALSSLPHPGPGGERGCGDGGVQLLEAAAILSHLSPDSETGTSLPEDRGMWPRWVSGGALEGEDDVPGSVPASVSSAYGYPSSVGGGGYSVGGGSEDGSAGWRGMCQCTIAYISDPPRPVLQHRGYAACPPPSASPLTLPVAHTSGGALEGEDDVPGSVPASVSSAYGYPSSVGGGGYSGGGGSEYGSAGWRGMRQCTIAYTSDPPRPVPRRRGYAARSLPAPIGIPADSPRRPHELTVRPALSPRRFEGRFGSSRRECPPFAQGSAWRSASPVVSSYARAPTTHRPHKSRY
ncbi:hypothetical protein B0H14DRAFT_3468966 [Mycena olivaceomarginata]|nr:hypothetical protein B0H14DRAFT_3468966 [Mycena olivaceomarginata]